MISKASGSSSVPTVASSSCASPAGALSPPLSAGADAAGRPSAASSPPQDAVIAVRAIATATVQVLMVLLPCPPEGAAGWAPSSRRSYAGACREPLPGVPMPSPLRNVSCGARARFPGVPAQAKIAFVYGCDMWWSTSACDR